LHIPSKCKFLFSRPVALIVSPHQVAAILGLVVNKKDESHIRLYSVAQMNLEQIFINLSRQQFKVEESFRELAALARSL
jgi:hypothetical protein